MAEIGFVQDCGCVVRVLSEPGGRIIRADIDYCPEHAAAPAMYQALLEINTWLGTDAACNALPYEPPWYQRLMSALANAHGIYAREADNE